jgi:hypothetical protein
MSQSKPVTPPPPDSFQSVETVSRVAVEASPVAQQISDAVTLMHTLRETDYAATLGKLRQNVVETTPTLEKLYHAVPEHNYIERWSLVKVMVDLHDASTLTNLHAIVNTPMPTGPVEPTPFTLAEETIIRTTAAEEIGRQAGAGHKEALPLLLKNCQNPVFSVRQASVQAYLSYGGPAARATLEKLIAPNEHFILDIRAISAAELTQPNAGAVKAVSAARESPVPPL